MNKKLTFIFIVILWAVIIGGFIIYKEFTLRTGEKVLLKTVPVDPRDLFRGDYVVLRYDISNLALNEFENSNLEIVEGNTVFIELGKDEKYWVAADIHKEKVESKLLLKGRVKSKRGETLNMEYGIESFFIPEGTGGELQRFSNSGELDVEVSVDKFGNGVIKDLYIDGKVWTLKQEGKEEE